MTGVAISGKAGTGKSTMAGKLIEAAGAQGIHGVKIAFGDELKREVFELYGIDKYMVGGRDVLIRHGEERRLADPCYWIRPVERRVRLAQVSGLLPVVDDVRFLREFEWAQEVGGLFTVRMIAHRDWRSEKLAQQGLCGNFADAEEVGETELEGVRHSTIIRNYTGATLDARAVQILCAAY